MLACCELISTPLRLGIARIQSFIVNLHGSYHDLYQSFETVKHLQTRVKKANQETVLKAEADLDYAVSDFKKKLVDIEAQYQNPYMEKVRAHYPELHRSLLVLREKTARDSRFKDLFPKEPL